MLALRVITALFVLASSAWADVTFVSSASSKDTTGAATTLTISNVNCGAGNLCKFSLVWRQTAAQTASTPTYGGSTTGITAISPTIPMGGTATGCVGGGCLKTWYACGLTGTQSVVFTVSAAANTFGVAAVYSGVDCAGTPVGTSVQSDSMASGLDTDVTTSVTTMSGGMAADALLVRDDVEATNNAGAGQTLRSHQSDAGSISIWTSTKPHTAGAAGMLSLQITDGNDDGYEEISEGNTNGTFGANAELCCHTIGPGTDYHAGWRWQGVSVPNGAVINSATLTLRARNAVTGTIGSVHGVFRGHKVGNANQWATGVIVPSTITPTTANTQYDPAVWVVDDYYAITVTSIVAELTSQGTWAAGNALSIALLNDGTTGDNSVRFYDFADGDTTASVLAIDYGDSGSMSWNWTPGSNNFVHIATPLNPGAAGGGGTCKGSLLLLGVGGC